MDKFADLHIHTHFSDGSSSPFEVIEEAHKNGISCIAITDHDTIDGIEPTILEAQKYNIEVIPGIELSAHEQKRDVHILGYFFDYKDARFQERLVEIQHSRLMRMEEMLRKLFDLGIKDIAMEEVCALSQSKSVGRPHLAQILIQKGHVGSIKEAFDQYLAEGAPAYVDKFKLTIQEAVDLIRDAKGLSVLAHPMVTNMDELIPQFVEAGLNGIEVFYPNCADNLTQYYQGIAKKRSLLVSGGSDSHGKSKRNTYIGKVKLPYAYVELFKEALKK